MRKQKHKSMKMKHGKMAGRGSKNHATGRAVGRHKADDPALADIRPTPGNAEGDLQVVEEDLREKSGGPVD